MKTEIVTLTCDSPRHGRPRPATVTRRFGLEGDEWETDLCGLDSLEFDTALAPYLNHGRKVVRPRRPQARRPAWSRRQKAEIRAWAIGAGLMVAGKGRIPASVTRAWEAEHG